MKHLLLAPVGLAIAAVAFFAMQSNTRPVIADEPADVADVAPPERGDVPVGDDGGQVDLGDSTLPDDGEGGIAVIGPDVIVGEVVGPQKFGTVGTITAYSIGTTSCNLGDQPLEWIQNSNRHPVIGQTIYRMKDGRFEQIGLGWLKHGFCALQNTVCGGCSPYCGGCCDHLGLGCSDPYSTDLNGEQGNLGPRYQVNPHSGQFTWPFATRGQTGNAIFKRVQVNNDDLNPSLNPGALYFGEGQYVALDDANSRNQNNNASYRRITVGSFSGGGYNLSFTGTTQRQQPALRAWKDNDPTVVVVSADVQNDGRFLVGNKVTNNGDGTWHYEYAIQNLNCERSAGAVLLPTGDSVVTNEGFRDIAYHSGEPFGGTDWIITKDAATIRWDTELFSSNPNANALRWGTTYNFRFDASTPPANGTGTISLFKPGAGGDPSSVNFFGRVPTSMGDMNCDGFIDNGDLDGFVLATTDAAGYAAAYPNCAATNADVNGDTLVDNGDIDQFVALLLGE